MSNDNLIQAAEKYSENYDGDDRQDIKVDVMNAFFGGWKFAQAEAKAQASDPKCDRAHCRCGVKSEPLTEAQEDEAAVDRFAVAMKEKLARARRKGRGGWKECDPRDLRLMLRDHVEKGDPRDVANFCMFLWNLGHGIAQKEEER